MLSAKTAAAACLVPFCLVLASCTNCSGSAVCGNDNDRNALGGERAGEAGEQDGGTGPGGLPGGFGTEAGGQERGQAPETVRFSGDALIGEYFDLDPDPPGRYATGGYLTSPNVDIYFYPRSMSGVAPKVTTAQWEGEREPTRAQCDEYLSRFAVQAGDREWTGEGTSFCARTDEGRTAFVRLKQRTASGYLADIVTWEK
ncbi:hypothetical protein ACGRHY_06080 [Streptomyces sp. HK10]|uniref:hypothetical protein n=1 Tax=Streptomyces sp. HK10 TaxID=3373255 RepID=UPI003747BDD4